MYPRYVERRLREALADTRVVLLEGPRQSGKTTLAKKVSADDMPFFTLDNASTLAAARADPVGFIRDHERAIIDEIQRAPELILAIKQAVDDNPRPGRYLLTGSANLLAVPRLADSLAGRMGTLSLLPLSQSELNHHPATFLDRVFESQPPKAGSPKIGDDLIDVVVNGGYPEALQRTRWLRRRDWYLDYVQLIIERDIESVADIELRHHMPRLLNILAEHSAQLVNYSSIGSPLDLSHVTTRKYVEVFENVFLTRTLQPWFSNRLSRLIKTPKLHFLDSGLLAALRGLSPERLKADRTPLGHLLETFVLAELLKLASWSDNRFEFFHYRDKEKNEVDIVIEDIQGRVVGIEVKAGATVRNQDFKGLKILAEGCGKRFACGIILYDDTKVLPFGEKMFAAPISALWDRNASG